MNWRSFWFADDFGIKKQRKGRNVLFVLLEVTNMKRIKTDPGMPIKGFCVERGSFVVVLEESICSLKHEEDVLLTRYIEARIIRVRDTNSLWRRRDQS